MTEPTIKPSATQLKALTHPLRLRMLALLRADGPATATQLAKELGVNSGATSYHLGQLNTHGFIDEASDLGSGREKYWQATAALTTFEDSNHDTADERDAKDAFRLMVAHTNARHLTETATRHSTLPESWRLAEYHGDVVVEVTSSQAAQIAKRLDDFTQALLDEYANSDATPGDDARTVELQFHSFVSLDEPFHDDE